MLILTNHVCRGRPSSCSLVRFHKNCRDEKVYNKLKINPWPCLNGRGPVDDINQSMPIPLRIFKGVG